MKNNILITSVGKRVALTKCFKDVIIRFFPEAKVFTTDMCPRLAPAGYVSDGCFEVPRVTDLTYQKFLLKICEDNNIGMIIATIDTELVVLANLKKEFLKKGIHVIVSDLPFVRICRDKRSTNVFFDNIGIKTPKTIDKNNPEFPLFVKPYDGSLSFNVHHIKRKEELSQEILNDPKLLFMEYIDRTEFKEYTVDMYFGRDNCVKCIVPRERIEIRAGEINKGMTEKNEILYLLKEKMGYIEGCIGCICVQLFFNPKTKDVFGIEINPRFGGGYPLTYMCGGNFPELLIREYFLGESIEYFDNWEENLLMLRYDDAIYVNRKTHIQ
jgi:carbamoyl-phosphate synthase large subunit